MTTIFFRFLRPEKRRRSWRAGGWAAFLVVGWSLLAALAPARAGLLPSSKERSQADALYQQAAAAYQSGDYAGALRLLDQAEVAKPDQADNWNLRGAIYLKQKAFEKAEAAFTRAATIDPTLWAAQFNQAEAPFQKKDFARARTLFERLLAQTDRYKAADKWELVAYKAFLSALLAGDDAGARKLLSKLPATGGKTPAFLYAQAALAFSRKDPTAARRTLAGAQTGFPPALNELFASSLEVAGWQAPANPLPMATADPATLAAMNAAGVTNPGNLTLPPAPGAPRLLDDHRAVVIDPNIIAASDPLPTGPGRGAGSTLLPTATPSPRRSPTGQPAPSPSPAEVAPAVGTPAPVLSTPPDSPLDHGGLLLGLD